MEQIQDYINRGFSLIPVKNNSKIPAIKWKKYQYIRASFEDILEWHCQLFEPNIGIITGNVSNLIVVDIDNISKLPELLKLLPETEKTTRVKTKRGYHFYFSYNGNEIKSTKNFLNLGIELNFNGRYVVTYPSKIDSFKYKYEIPLSKIITFPSLLKKPIEQVKNAIIKKAIYRGKASCISQILHRDLEIGERNINLFILYYLLLQNGNKKEYAQDLVIKKNHSLREPLTDKEIKNLFRKRYSYTCSRIREDLCYINCEDCQCKFQGGFKMGNIIIKNLRELENLEPSEQRVLLFLGTYYDGEKPSITALANKVGMNFNTAKNAVKGLKKKGILT